ncbi:hypothetical protein [Sphingobacterium zeae]|uniref:hypothetical protein n=1 Tax=Sphingobacterium zeae TaxID=1776859 RepID=UPI003612016B
MPEYYKYKNNIYKLIDHAQHKTSGSEDIPVVVYTDGNILYTRNVSEFYERFTQIPHDSLEVAVFELKLKT